MKPLPRKSPVVINKKRRPNTTQQRFLLESNIGGTWQIIQRFDTEGELVAAIGKKSHLRGRASMPKLKWKFFYPKGGDECKMAA